MSDGTLLMLLVQHVADLTDRIEVLERALAPKRSAEYWRRRREREKSAADAALLVHNS